MAIHMRYRGIQFAKDYVCKYLNACYMAQAKGAVVFTDGTNNIEFSRTPVVLRAHSWTSQNLPAILIGAVGGKFEERGFSDNLIRNEGDIDAGTGEFLGGDIQMDMEIIIRARTTVERENLVDMTCILLSSRAAKAYFLRQDIKIPAPPSISGESEVEIPAIDFPVFDTRLTLPLESGWSEWTDLNDRLIDIITDVTLLS